MAERTRGDRYEFFVLLKAVAIYYVCFYHFNNLPTNFLQTGSFNEYFNYTIKGICSSSVPIFFFVHGALILNKGFDLRRHVEKAITIGVLTVAWAALTMLLLMPITGEYMTFREFAKNIWIWKMGWINHLWFLQTMVVIYIFFPLMKSAYDHDERSLRMFLAVAFLLTYGNVFLTNCANALKIAAGLDDLRTHFNYFNNFNAFRNLYGYAFPCFIAGGYFLKHRKIFEEGRWFLAAALAVPASLLLLAGYGVMMSKALDYEFDTVWMGLDMLPILCIVFASFVLSLRYKGENRLAGWIRLAGDNSLGIYLTHVVWGTLFVKYYKRLPFSDHLATNLLFGLFLLTISLLSTLLLKRIPGARRLVSL